MCRGGGIGRRAGFKIRCWQQRVGSSPTLGTKNFPYKNSDLHEKYCSCVLIINWGV